MSLLFSTFLICTEEVYVCDILEECVIVEREYYCYAGEANEEES